MPILPPHYLDAVVALGQVTPDGDFIPTASAFFLGKLVPKANETDEGLYKGYLVTNRHVLEDREFIAMRLNRLEGNPSARYIVPRFDKKKGNLERWHFHPDKDIDIAIIDIGSDAFVKDGISFSYFRDDFTYLMRDDFQNLAICEGDLVYTLGFPMGLAGKERNYTIARMGCIARIQDYLAGTSNSFLIDCSIFPGNSGGPVVLRPSFAGIDKQPVTRAHLLGIVNAYIPYTDTAVSLQTGLERIRFQENSNLATVHPVEYIDQTILDYLKTKPESKE